MSNTWEVWAWRQMVAYGGVIARGDHGYVRLYAGESLYRAVRVARLAKRRGDGCVKIEWRSL